MFARQSRFARRSRGQTRRWLVLATCIAAASALAGCGGGGEQSGPNTIVVATHDSWAMPKKVLTEFTDQTGIAVKIQPQGDAGELTNKLVLTKDNPLADGVYGIDNTFAGRAVDEGVLAPYRSSALPGSARQFLLGGKAGDLATPIDYGDVCLNIDDTWFQRNDVAPPRGLDDLVEPRYRGLFVTPGATTSSPGLAFLLATIAARGDGWQDYWKQLMANDTKITSGWSDAYEVDFTAGGGNGDRPIVTSYSSSPPFTIPEGGSQPTTSALLDTCFRQVEYAGVLDGADNPDGMEKFIDFMLGKRFQAALPDNMYVYPVNDAVELPGQWAKFAPPAADPYTMDATEIDTHRQEWLSEWRDITSR